jgi:hypothetical protein
MTSVLLQFVDWEGYMLLSGLQFGIKQSGEKEDDET